MARPQAPAHDAEVQRKLSPLLKLYDDGDFKRGLKQLKPLVRQYPDHPELKAVRALFLRADKVKDESSKLMAEALRADMNNPRIWKYQGILHKQNADYTKAAQCLMRSLNLDSSDRMILQDLCNLLLFERNFPVLLNYSKQLLQVTTSSNAVMRYAISLQFSGRLQAAHSFLASYERNLLPSDVEEELVFRSELSLHQATLLLQLGRAEDCIAYLRASDRIRDQASKLEIIASAQQSLGLGGDVLATARDLIALYPENGDYFRLLEAQLSGEELIRELLAIKAAHASRYAEVRILELLPIDDARFADGVRAYLVPYLVKGSPAVFVCLAELAREKLDVCVEVARAAEVPLTSVPIVHNFVAEVLLARGDYEGALVEVEAGIAHTPTVLELWQNKIRILRRLGRVSEGAAVAVDLVTYDPADRNANTVHLNALLLNGELKRAVEAALPFSIDHKARPKLFQTQYNRLCLHCAECAVRQGDRENGINFYRQVLKNFEQFRKSEFNYLGWGMKKTVALVKVIKWSNALITDRVLARAGFALLRLLLGAGDRMHADELAMKFLPATDPPVVALAAVAFALGDQVLPAIKCFRKAAGAPARFAAAPAVARLMANLGGAHESVRQVALELYAPVAEAPETAAELVMAARGAFYVGERPAAADALTRAAAQPGLSFKFALEIFGVAAFEFADEALAAIVEERILQANPAYEIRPRGKYELPDLAALQAEDD